MSIGIDNHPLLTWEPKDRTRGSQCRKFGNWKVVVTPVERAIYHYTTLMLVVDNHGMVLVWSIGEGTKSDQQMMNRLFSDLPNCGLRFMRNGGNPRIEEIGVV